MNSSVNFLRERLLSSYFFVLFFGCSYINRFPIVIWIALIVSATTIYRTDFVCRKATCTQSTRLDGLYVQSLFNSFFL